MPGNSEVARAAYDAFNRGDIDDVLTVFSPDIEFNASDVFFDQRRTYRGPDEWRDEFVPAVFEVFTTYRADPEEVIDLGDDRVLVILRAGGLGKASGAEASARVAHIIEFEDGHATVVTEYKDVDEGRAVAGLDQ